MKTGKYWTLFQGLYQGCKAPLIRFVSGAISSELALALYLAMKTSMDWPCFETRQTNLHEITEVRITGKTKGRRKIQILHDLANDGGYCCTQMGSWGQRGMETQRKDVKKLLYNRRLLMMMMMMMMTLNLSCSCWTSSVLFGCRLQSAVTDCSTWSIHAVSSLAACIDGRSNVWAVVSCCSQSTSDNSNSDQSSSISLSLSFSFMSSGRHNTSSLATVDSRVFWGRNMSNLVLSSCQITPCHSLQLTCHHCQNSLPASLSAMASNHDVCLLSSYAQYSNVHHVYTAQRQW